MRLKTALFSLLVGLVVLLVYTIVAHETFFLQSIAAYFSFLAEALLDGETAIAPATFGSKGYDLLIYEGRYYVAQAPLPALLMMPFVRVFGVYNVSDVMFTVVTGSASVATAFMVLRRAGPNLTLVKTMLLVFFFAFGTPFFSLTVFGTVWFQGQVTAVLFLWLYAGGVLEKRWLFAGMMLGLVTLARPASVPGALIFAGVYLWFSVDSGERVRTTLIKNSLLLILPIILSTSLLGFYNVLRFGNPLEFGYQYIDDASNIRENRNQHGIFSLKFLPHNLYVATIHPPAIKPECFGPEPGCRVVQPDPLGMGFIWTSPLLLFVFNIAGYAYVPAWQRWGTTLTIIGILLPSLLYHNTGSIQFGYRFLVDALPFWMILLAWAIKPVPLWIIKPVVIGCGVVNLYGAVWLINLLRP